MCTVTYYKKGGKIIITSNRDEKFDRPVADKIEIQNMNGRNLFFPKDPKAGGTWFVVNENGYAFVLLNGAKSKHITNPPYKKSRGVILLELASKIEFELEWDEIDLTQIEPFTIIAYLNKRLIQLRWNGKKKEFKKLNDSEHHIWSSITLYELSIIKLRKIWFDAFIAKINNSLTPENIIYFHTQTQIDDSENGILINSENEVFTKNITQFELEEKYFKLVHLELISNTINIIKEELK